MINKKCSNCKEIKDINKFSKNKDGKYGCHSICKDCRNLDNKTYRENNPEKIREKNRRYIKNNPLGSWKDWKEKNPEKNKKAIKDWLKNNPHRVKELNRQNSAKRRLNPMFKLSDTISNLIRLSLKNNKNGYHWEDLVNFTLQDLIVHLEKQFKDGMNWNNQGKWHIDHIKPISNFSFNSYEDKDFQECWSLRNLQPLWAIDNLRKGNR